MKAAMAREVEVEAETQAKSMLSKATTNSTRAAAEAVAAAMEAEVVAAKVEIGCRHAEIITLAAAAETSIAPTSLARRKETKMRLTRISNLRK
mmetsp:Transcript_29879/g.92365  ORF Transcript_29879/g.92365 Transcript_29879/m.92365 type:complete len:93 (+) Transcript_29879:432-710(+)